MGDRESTDRDRSGSLRVDVERVVEAYAVNGERSRAWAGNGDAFGNGWKTARQPDLSGEAGGKINGVDAGGGICVGDGLAE